LNRVFTLLKEFFTLLRALQLLSAVTANSAEISSHANSTEKRLKTIRNVIMEKDPTHDAKYVGEKNPFIPLTRRYNLHEQQIASQLFMIRRQSAEKSL
jgi:hypothetical protein